MLISKVNIVTDKEVFFGNVEVKNGKFTKIQKLANTPKQNAKYILPGFIDSHTHGGYGWDFNSLAKNDLNKAKDYLKGIGSEGVTTVIGTTVTCSKQDLKNISKNWKNFAAIDENNIVAGWYIEGPYISIEKRSPRWKVHHSNWY